MTAREQHLPQRPAQARPAVSTPSLAYTLLHTLAQNVPHRIYAKDAEGRFTFANQAVASGMGVADPAQLLGKSDFDFYPAEDAREYLAQEQQVMHSGQPMLSREEHVQYLLLQQEAWLLTTKIPLRDENGCVTGLVGINYDITPQKVAEHALRAANQQAAAAARELQDTLARLQQEMRERQRMEEELRRQSLHDGLTGLPNRRLLMDRLEHAIALAQRRRQPLTLLFIDLDRFKIVNDSLGHELGDQMLRITTQRIAECVRASDTFARLGGDEFVLLLPDAMPDDMLARLISRIRHAVAQPVTLAGHEVSLTCSVGYSFYPQDGTDAATLLRHADAALFSAKEQGRNNARGYRAEMHQGLSEQLETESHLRRALQRGEFLLHYQPQVDLQTGLVCGVEALIRWQHPEWGMVPPLRFIPIAEESGLIGPIGEWVLRTACEQAMAWRRAGLPPLRMSVNLSARQFQDPALEGQVAAVLAETGLPPQLLELELTESVSMKDPQETIRILDRFNALGIRLAIDDFGTGYSNLSYLRRFPVHRLKLDRSFVADLTREQNSHVICEAIVAMAHKLRLEVVAEGVETAEHRDLLIALGCDAMQGYFYSRPLAAAACAALLRERTAATASATRPAGASAPAAHAALPAP
jgi:diguanylate cyclase (GGDEF)-like protein/PAS domain S-box-containing protein